MNRLYLLILPFVLMLSSCGPKPLVPWEEGAFETREYRNLFVEAGYAPEDVEAKLQEVFEEVFFGPDKVYFEVEDSLAYVSDIKNNDVRTEGMSYGMMVAVQMDRKDIFDKLFRWCKKYMQHQDGPLEGYFAWSCGIDGKRKRERNGCCLLGNSCVKAAKKCHFVLGFISWGIFISYCLYLFAILCRIGKLKGAFFVVFHFLLLCGV